jgi:3-oxoacyl-[acyl-carrier protein] reductase
MSRDRDGGRSKGRPDLDPREQRRHQPPQRLHRRSRSRHQGLAGRHRHQFNVTHAFLGQLRAAKGRIVNIASIQSFVHVRTPNSPAYTTSKHGVLGFTRALAAELGKDGVRVNAIGPGLIETPLNEKVRASNPELVKIFLDHTPLGRAGKPEDIVGPALFLASDLSAYVTGSIIMADGGYRAI